MGVRLSGICGEVLIRCQGDSGVCGAGGKWGGGGGGGVERNRAWFNVVHGL